MIVRLRFRKLGKLRFLSHRDLARIIERCLRRADLPIVYSQGFSPRPRLSFGLALPTTYESDAEYLDIRLDPEADGLPDGFPDALPATLSALLPDGLDITAAAVIPASADSLQQSVTSSTWVIEPSDAPDGAIRAAADRVLASATLPIERERKGKRTMTDIRPDLHRLDVRDHHGLPVLVADLATGTRPAELLAALALEAVCVRRTHQWITRDGARHEPLESAAPSPGYARACAP